MLILSEVVLMDKEIQDAFVDGLNEVYSIMFTDGVSDGVNLYLLSPDTDGGFYGESKVNIIELSSIFPEYMR